jgi:hypothetical protein
MIDTARYMREFEKMHPAYLSPANQQDELAITGEDFTRNPAMCA